MSYVCEGSRMMMLVLSFSKDVLPHSSLFRWHMEVERISRRILVGCWQHLDSDQHWIEPSVGRVWIERWRHWSQGVCFHRIYLLQDQLHQQIPDRFLRSHLQNKVLRWLLPVQSCFLRRELRTWMSWVYQSPTWWHRSFLRLEHKQCISSWTSIAIVLQFELRNWMTWWRMKGFCSIAYIQRGPCLGYCRGSC